MTTYWRWIAIVAVLFASPLLARDIYVDPDHGDDGADGLAAVASAGKSGPVKTIARGVALADAGDTVNLTPRPLPYHESVVLHNRSGEPGKPLIIDGHGATLTGVDLINPSGWKETAPGLFRNDTYFTGLKGDDSLVQRLFIRFDGQMQHMGRTSKGPKEDFKSPDALQPGEWTFQQDSKAIYVRISPGQSLADAHIEMPMRNSGVRIHGEKNEHLIIRNIISTHFWNDGYNIHNESKDLLFENIQSYENGDDGISAHEYCEYEVNGFTASRNSTGVCNINHCSCKLANIHLTGNYGSDFLAEEGTSFDVTNAIIDCSASARPVVMMGHVKTNDICTVKMNNVLIRNSGHAKTGVEVDANAVFDATHLTVIGMPWLVQGKSSIKQSVICGPIVTCAPNCIWAGDGNLYNIDRFKIGGKTYSADKAADYQTAVPTDHNSQWQALSSDELEQIEQGIGRPKDAPGASVSEMKIPTSQPAANDSFVK